MYEYSIKVPFIASHPGRLPPGHIAEAMVSAYDFMPTLLDYLDLPLPATQNLPGRSFLPALRGEADAGHDEVVIYDEYGPVRMIRTAEWKYVYRDPSGPLGGPLELYDLVNDPDERRNLAGEPDQQTRMSALHARMEAWFARYVLPERDGMREPDELVTRSTGGMHVGTIRS
jgi:arylsulfatase A-like enzyme